MSKKQVIRLNESQLRQIVKKSVKMMVNEQYGVDFEDTLRWVQNKFPDKSPDEQERFARNIIGKREKEKEYYTDALEALQMSDGLIDFWGWYPSFQDELEPNEAEKIFNRAEENYMRLRKRKQAPLLK